MDGDDDFVSAHAGIGTSWPSRGATLPRPCPRPPSTALGASRGTNPDPTTPLPPSQRISKLADQFSPDRDLFDNVPAILGRTWEVVQAGSLRVTDLVEAVLPESVGIERPTLELIVKVSHRPAGGRGRAARPPA